MALSEVEADRARSIHLFKEVSRIELLYDSITNLGSKITIDLGCAKRP